MDMFLSLITRILIDIFNVFFNESINQSCIIQLSEILVKDMLIMNSKTIASLPKNNHLHVANVCVPHQEDHLWILR